MRQGHGREKGTVLLQGRFDQAFVQRMSVGRTGFKFRMELAADEPGMIFEFDDFYQAVVRRRGGQIP